MAATTVEEDGRLRELRLRAGDNWQRVQDFEDRMQLPLVLSAVVPIVLGLAQVTDWVSAVVGIVTWLVFVADLVFLMRNVRGYLKTFWGKFDLVIVILTFPWFLIPGFEFAGLLMLARLGRLVRLFLASSGARRLMRRVGSLGLYATSMVLLTAWVTWRAERGTNPEFGDYGDAVWWAIVTMTTVGYGDIVPESMDGRVAAALLMMSAIGLLAALSGTLASFFRSSTAEEEAEEAPPTVSPDEVESLRTSIAELSAQLRVLQAGLPAPTAGASPADPPSAPSSDPA